MKTEHLLKWFRVNNKATSNEAGQSIVLIALALIGLVAFMGIAIDVGFIFARGSQLQAAIDSAALAGVTELGSWSSNNQTGPEAAARTKSAQFLNANGMPLSVTTSLNQSSNLHVEIDPLGATEYSISATWPVETFFLNVIGFDQDINLTRSATAAVFSLANIYASRRIEDGVLSTSNQSVFGQNICTSYGDPFSPINSLWNPGPYSYEYRIMIPPHYPSNILRVELFDPDSINASSNGPFSIPRTDAAINAGLPPLLDNQYCSNADQKNACLIDTNELSLVPSLLTLDQINPYFFWRIDENRGAGSSAPGNGNCGSPLSYDATFNTRTLYQLYYFMQNPDGTTQRIDLASYTGQVDDGTRDNGDHHTDMHWVSPGAAQQAFDYPIDPNTNQPYNVPVDAGSTRTFELNLDQEVPNMMVDQSTGNRFINLSVTALDGASENGYEIWAGPPDTNIPSEANARNLRVLNNPGAHSSQGATVYASGNLPMNSNTSNRVEIPLIYVDPDMIDQDIFISLFDTDAGAQPPITFYFDTIAQSDWSKTFAQSGVSDPDGQTRNCVPGNCHDIWVNPPYQIKVPGDTSNCDYNNPDPDDCTPFYGGRLMASYHGGGQDTYGWQITVSGVPYLVR